LKQIRGLSMEGLAESKEELRNKLRNTIVLSNFTVMPLFSEVWKTVHPAIDVVDGVAYVGVNLPCEVRDAEGKAEVREFHFLVNSKGEKILCHKEELSKLRLQLRHSVVKLPNRWSLESVKAWLDNRVRLDPCELYIAIKTVFETYIEFEDSRVYNFLTLWTIGTYFFHLFNAYPYLYIGGTKQSGKTKLLTLLSLLCHNAIFSNNISTASAFRLIQSGRCTLLMDETEKLINPERELDFRNMLYAGYKKGALVYRTHKDTLKPEPFEVYSPKALANIRGVEDVLEDRCITIILKRGKNLDIVNREIPLESEVWQQIRDMLYVFYLSRFNELSELSELSEQVNLLEEAGLKQRELELWKPILVLACFFDKYLKESDKESSSLSKKTSSQSSLFNRILDFAKEKTMEKEVENRTETLDLILAQTLLSIVKEDAYFKVKEIKDAMASCFDEPQKWLTTRWVGNALRRLGFMDKRRFGSGYEYFLAKDKVLDLAERLGISETLSPDSSQSSPSSLSSPLPSIPEVYEALREQFKEPFDEGKAVSFIAQLRKCDFEEAKRLFQIFVDEGKLFKDNYGLWVWSKPFSPQKEVSPEPKSEPILEKKLETFHIGENRGIVDNSKIETPKGLIQCELCGKQGKPMFFATKADLERHVLAFHGGYPDSKLKPDYVR
jgi:hypothetical protein